MSFWKNLFLGTKEKSVLVKTLRVEYQDINRITKDSTDHCAFWHLHETESGRRYVNMQTGYRDNIPLSKITEKSLRRWEAIIRNRTDKRVLAFLLSSDQWNNTVYPWLTGRRIPGIPSYGDVPKEDFKRALKEG